MKTIQPRLLIILGAFISLASSPLFSQEISGSLTLTTSAQGEVRLLSAPRGSPLRGRLGDVTPDKPLVLSNLIPGRYRLEVVFDAGFYVFRTRKDLDLKFNENRREDVSPSNYVLSLQGTGDSTGAEVLVNNLSQGVIPLEIEIPVGSMVEVRQKGYEIGFFQFDSPPAQRKFSTVELTPTPALMEIRELRGKLQDLEAERKVIFGRRSGSDLAAGLFTLLGLGAAGAAGYSYYMAQQELLAYDAAVVSDVAVSHRKSYNFHVNLVQLGTLSSASGLGLGLLFSFWKPTADTSQVDLKIADLTKVILEKEDAL